MKSIETIIKIIVLILVWFLCKDGIHDNVKMLQSIIRHENYK